MRRYRVLYPRPTKYQPAKAEVLEAILVEGGEEAETIRQSLLVRMHDVSQFMKTLKQRFSIWYNRNYGRIGTLWSERFKSTLIENAYYALRIVAAYVDLNPIRAGVVSDPKDYRWSTYGQAVGGDSAARKSISAAVGSPSGSGNWLATAREHRRLLYSKGASSAPEKQTSAARIPTAAWRREMERGAELPISSALRCKVRYFVDGAVIGKRSYILHLVNRVGEGDGSRRHACPGKMRGSHWGGLTVLRKLRGNLFG